MAKLDGRTLIAPQFLNDGVPAKTPGAWAREVTLELA